MHLLFRGHCVGEFLGEGNAQLEAADNAANDVERADEIVLFLRFSGVLLGARHAPLQRVTAHQRLPLARRSGCWSRSLRRAWCGQSSTRKCLRRGGGSARSNVWDTSPKSGSYALPIMGRDLALRSWRMALAYEIVGSKHLSVGCLPCLN